jgi:hypothetical protein
VDALSTPGIARSGAMAERHPQIVGNWDKVGRTACDEMYPDSIRFQDNGLYFGLKDPPGTFTQWDVGTYEITGSERINISTANDAIVTYSFAISDDILTFVDHYDCQFRYRRAG